MHWLFMARKVHFMRSGRGRATPVSSASADAAADMAASVVRLQQRGPRVQEAATPYWTRAVKLFTTCHSAPER